MQYTDKKSNYKKVKKKMQINWSKSLAKEWEKQIYKVWEKIVCKAKQYTFVESYRNKIMRKMIVEKFSGQLC